MKKIFLVGVLLAVCMACLCVAAACSGEPSSAVTHTVSFTFNGEEVTETSPVYFNYAGSNASYNTEVQAQEGKTVTVEVYLADYLNAATLQVSAGAEKSSGVVFTLAQGYDVESIGWNFQKVGEIALGSVTADQTLALSCDEHKIELQFATTDTPQNPHSEDEALQNGIYADFEVWAGESWRRLADLTAGGQTGAWTTFSALQEPLANGGMYGGLLLRSEKYPHSAFFGGTGFATVGSDTPNLEEYGSGLHEYLLPVGFDAGAYAKQISVTFDPSMLQIWGWSVNANGSVWSFDGEKYIKPQLVGAGGTIANASFTLDNRSGTIDFNNVKVYLFEEELTAEDGVYTITKAPCEYTGYDDSETYVLTLEGLDENNGDALNKISVANTNEDAKWEARDYYLYYQDENAVYYPADEAQANEAWIEVRYSMTNPDEIVDFTQTAAYQDRIDFTASLTANVPGLGEQTESFVLADLLPGKAGVTAVSVGSGSDEAYMGQYTIATAADAAIRIEYSIYRSSYMEDEYGEKYDVTYEFTVVFRFAPVYDMQAAIS